MMYLFYSNIHVLLLYLKHFFCFSSFRFPWIAPERRLPIDNKLPDLTYESEVYALGTAFYEILCRNDNFGEQLEIDNRDPEVVSKVECLY